MRTRTRSSWLPPVRTVLGRTHQQKSREQLMDRVYVSGVLQDCAYYVGGVVLDLAAPTCAVSSRV